jgi:hypothetical protein
MLPMVEKLAMGALMSCFEDRKGDDSSTNNSIVKKSDTLTEDDVIYEVIAPIYGVQ